MGYRATGFPEGRGRFRRSTARYCLTGLGLARYEAHAGLADRIGRSLGRRWPGYEDDVLQAAREGLIDAAALFDEATGKDFERFAARSIYGECFNSLRVWTRMMTPYRPGQIRDMGPRPKVVPIPDGLSSSGSHSGVDAVDARDEVAALTAGLPDGDLAILREHFHDGVAQGEMSIARGRHRTWAHQTIRSALVRVRRRVAEMEAAGTYVA